jgi:hypothetical protein
MMRALSVVLLGVTASGVRAAPAPAPAPAPALSWGDWIGDWEGKLEWTSCTADGAARAKLPIDASDGAVSIDLAPAGSALREMSLAEDGTGWIGQQADVTVRLRRVPRATGQGSTRSTDMIELAIDLESGCSVRGTLARGTVGIPECDRLAAWARVEAQCTKLSRPPLENPARVARQRAEWAKASGEARTKIAAQCTARGTKLESSLIDAGCAPHADPAIGLRGTECPAMRMTAARIARCTSVPPELRAAFEREVVVLAAAAQGADKASLPVVDAECKRTREKLLAISQQVGCPP